MYEAVKRSFDVVMSATILLAIVPIWMAVAIAIKATTPGPILHRGSRIGKRGKPFIMYKFRTMTSGAEEAGPGITGARDPRITSVGRVLRTWKLDELPQLWNVLRGEMSLVGPRPEAPRYVALYNERQLGVLAVRPGITGPTQIRYRHEERLLGGTDVEAQYRTLLPHKLEIDLHYVQTRSLLRDVALLAGTVRSIVMGEPEKLGKQA